MTIAELVRSNEVGAYFEGRPADSPRAEPRTHGTRPGWLTLAAALFATIAIGAAWVLAFGTMVSGIEQRRSQAVLHDRWRSAIANDVAPEGNRRIGAGTPVAALRFPGDNGDGAIVVEGTTSGQLRTAPGHRRDTVLPGEEGTSVLMGRASWFGGPFARVRSLRRGDVIRITTGEGSFRFKVEGVRRDGDPLAAPVVAGEGRLTLMTSERAPKSVGTFAVRTVFVDAQLIGDPAPPSVRRPTSLVAAETTLRGDARGLIPATLWLEVLLVVLGGLAWVVTRWKLAPTVIVGVPIVFAVLWAGTDAVAILLPNLV
ncbi:MAG: sortase [Actinomycetota bacterium]